MTPAEADAAIEDIWNRLDSLTREYADNLAKALNNPNVPMLQRCMMMSRVIATAAQGMMIVVTEDGPATVNKFHMVEMLPDLIIGLRAAADLFEAANKGRTN